MLFFGFFAVVFMFVSTTLVEREMLGIGVRRGELAKETCFSLRDELNTAVAIGDGYWKTAQVKRELGERYEIRVKRDALSVRIGEGDDAYYLCAVSAQRIEGLPYDSEGMIVDSRKKLIVRNQDGVIELEQ